MEMTNKKNKSFSLIGLFLVITLVVFCMDFANAKVQPRNDTKYIEIAENVASQHTWIFRKYMCGDFAWDLAQNLIKEGYVSKIKFGRWFQGGVCEGYNYKHFRCYHYWVEVKINGKWIPIESTGGYVIDAETYKKEYKK